MADRDVLMGLLETRSLDGIPENLHYVRQLGRFADGLAGFEPPDEPLVGDLAPVRRLRDRLVPTVLGTDSGWARDELSLLAREYAISPALGKAGLLHYVSGLAGFVPALAARLVPAAMQLHTSGMVNRIRCCAAAGCPASFIDTTRRGQRLYCSGACSARHRMRRSRGRGVGDAGPGPLPPPRNRA